VPQSIAAANTLRRAGAIAFLMVIQFFYAWAWSSVDVLRPALRDSLGLSLVQAGAAYSVQVAGALLAALLIGQIEHLLGRRHVMAAATFGFGATLAAGALVPDWPTLLLQRFLLGWFAGAVFPLTIGTIVDLFSPALRGKLASLIDATYFLAVIALGAAAAIAPSAEWRLVLIWGGVPPMLFAAGVYLLVPSAIDEKAERRAKRGDVHVGRLFGNSLARRTVALAVMIGASSSGAQAFSGWLTTYLAEVRAFNPDQIAFVLSCQFGASAAGAFVWGWVVDRVGRRAGAAGMLGAGGAIIAFLLLPLESDAIFAAAAAYGFCFSAVVSLGPWIAELYPPHLRSSATSIYQWGRFISLFSPLVTGSLAGFVGLAAAMGLGSLAFLIAGSIWLRLPETLAGNSQPRPDSARS